MIDFLIALAIAVFVLTIIVVLGGILTPVENAIIGEEDYDQ